MSFPWTSMRYIGSAPMDKPPLGTWLKAYQSKFEHLELPGEPFSYSIYLGDYHAPLSGYYLMGLCAMAMLLYGRTGQRRYAVIAGCTLTWTLLANTWVLPLQALGVAPGLRSITGIGGAGWSRRWRPGQPRFGSWLGCTCRPSRRRPRDTAPP